MARELQKLTNELSIPVQVCHFPPGTSKWNKIQHRMFCHITANWRGRPLVSREVVVNLIASTTTWQGLKIKAGLDENRYEAGTGYRMMRWPPCPLRQRNFMGHGTTGSTPRQFDILPSLSLRSPRKRKGRGFLPANSPD